MNDLVQVRKELDNIKHRVIIEKIVQTLSKFKQL